jgi:hypothetical protein
VKIELIGGPKCGEIVATEPDLLSRVSFWDWQGYAVTYKRRDVSTSIKPMYGKAGHRLYDLARA